MVYSLVFTFRMFHFACITQGVVTVTLQSLIQTWCPCLFIFLFKMIKYCSVIQLKCINSLHSTKPGPNELSLWVLLQLSETHPGISQRKYVTMQYGACLTVPQRHYTVPAQTQRTVWLPAVPLCVSTQPHEFPWPPGTRSSVHMGEVRLSVQTLQSNSVLCPLAVAVFPTYIMQSTASHDNPNHIGHAGIQTGLDASQTGF